VKPDQGKPATVGPVAVCQNDVSVPLAATAAAGSKLNWYTNASLTSGSATAPVPSTATPGTTYYFVSQTSNAGCESDTAMIPVTVNTLPVPNFQLPGAICMVNGQATAQFTNTSTGASAYTWNFGDGTATVSTPSPSHTYFGQGPYQVTLRATTTAGCYRDTTKTLAAFLQKPVAAFNVSPTSVCQGMVTYFTDRSAAQGTNIQTWKWWFGDGSTSSVKDPSKIFAFPGTYNVRLAVQTVEGCKSDTISQPVLVNVQPVIDAGPSFVVPSGTRITFAASVADSTGLVYTWTPATALDNAGILRPSLTATTNQVYKLTATGLGQCTATDTLSVKVLLPVSVPNAFSPNGDGINDTWRLDNLKDYPGTTVEVYNRYGQRVFRSQGYSQPWDGMLNGKSLPIGVYYYIIDLKNGFQQLTGNVSLLK